MAVLGSGMVKAWLLVLFGLLVVAPGEWMGRSALAACAEIRPAEPFHTL